MSEGGEPPPLDQRKRREGLRTGIPRSTARKDLSVAPLTEVVRSRSRIRIKKVSQVTNQETNMTREDEDANLAANVAESTFGAEVAKRPRPEDSSPDSPAQGDSRHPPRKYLALPPPPSPLQTQLSPQPMQPSPPPPLPLSPQGPPRSSPRQPRPLEEGHPNDSSELASWPLDSTSYAGLASPTMQNVHMEQARPISPQPSTSYAAAATTLGAVQRIPPPTTNKTDATTAPKSAPRSTYPPLVVECLPNWTRHFENLRRELGHAPNARPLGVRSASYPRRKMNSGLFSVT
ncbi:jg25669 [Pararge aegeria aegeria]|uniref:Jg25669 protein n=1 Tax=Pararge aegeria aegeria TaxID=348720 RepID=A0A8S4QPP0_9NEOP|nr:jg25669 [Pararge aegeria aegeria]